MFGDSHMQRMNWNELLNRSDIANRGMNLDISDGLLHRVGTVIACNPKIVFIEAGGNDIMYKVPYSAFVSQMSKIVDSLSSKGITVIMNEVYYCKLGYPKSKERNKQVAIFNKGLDSIAKVKNLPIIRLGLKDDCLFDDSHLNYKGYSIWKEEIVKYLK